MKSLLLIIFLSSFGNFANPWLSVPNDYSIINGHLIKESTLRLVHILFRHGNRNPEEISLWKENPYRNESYYPEGYGQLINEGKWTMYNLGRFLRARYDDFLEDVWNIKFLEVRTTDVDRTKMSAQLVLAGLYPPNGDTIWNFKLPWLPIPYNYVPISQDKLFYQFLDANYQQDIRRIIRSPVISYYLRTRYGELMNILSQQTGIEVDDYLTALMYLDGIKVQRELGVPLDEWTSIVSPEPHNSLAVDFFYIWTNSSALRQIMAGNFVKKVITDTQSFISGNLSVTSRKMFIYSAHDTNIGGVLLTLDAMQMTETPPYGSAIIFEVHEVDGVYGVKLFYVDHTKESPKPMAIPGCPYFCPIDLFYFLLKDILP